MPEKLKNKVLNIAHRGGAGLSPENTVYAFSRALNCFGADVLEMDIWSSCDGHLVVFHDQAVDRTTNGSGDITHMSLAEIKKLDAAFRFTTDGGLTYPLRGMGITVPTLREVFELFSGNGINIEIKHYKATVVENLYRLIMEYGLNNSVLVATKDNLTRKRFAGINQAGIATSASVNQGILFTMLSEIGLDYVYHPRINVFQFPPTVHGLRVITPKLVKAAHRQKKFIHAWTVNDVAEMKKLIAMGVDGIITDYPDRLRSCVTP